MLDSLCVAKKYIGFSSVVQDLPTPFLRSAYSESVCMPPVRIGMLKAVSGLVLDKIFGRVS
jgi:hypothetical protein